MEIKETLTKPYTEQQRTHFIVINEDVNGYKIIETETELQAWGKTAEEELINAKNAKYAENEKIRDAFMIAPIVYKNIEFDCDMEQAQNLDYQERHMTDTETVEWTAYDGVTKVECTKEDIQNLGGLIVTKRQYVWSVKNPQIKTAIANATTVAEVNAIEIVYSLDEMTAQE